MAKQEYPIDRVEFVKLMARLETVERHHNDFRETFKNINESLSGFKNAVVEINTKIDTLPQRVHAMEIEKAKNEGYISAFKYATGILIGLVISYAVRDSFIANREEKQQYKKEVKQ